MTDETPDFDAAHCYRSAPFFSPLDLKPTLFAWLDQRNVSEGQAPYLTTISATGAEATLTYRELDVLSRRLGRWLQTAAAVRPGEVVGLAPLNDIASVLAIFAIWRTGSTVLLLNPRDPPERVLECRQATGARVVLRAPDVSPQIAADALAIPFDIPIVRSAEKLIQAVDPFAAALLFGTSGSTAVSKLVAQSHYNAAVNAEAMRKVHGLNPGDRFLGCLPIHHVNGLHLTLMGTLAAGAHAILPVGFDPLRYPKILERFRPKIASVVPSILDALVEIWRDPDPPRDFDYFVSAAAPLSSRTARAVRDRFGRRVLQGYGLTETVNFSTATPRSISVRGYDRFVLGADIPSIGVQVFGNEVAVLRPDLSPSASGESGEICIRGHNVMLGYAGNSEATAEAFRGGWFHTQDLGFSTTDADSGEVFITITGRTKNVAKVRGESVSLDEMDRVLLRAPHVTDVACVALTHTVLGEEIVAVVVTERPVDDAALLSILRSVFAEAVLPRRIVHAARLPRTPTGKILRRQLIEDLARQGGDSAIPTDQKGMIVRSNAASTSNDSV